MPIQWFPGHMNVTRKAIAERLPDIDVVIELLDARLPASSANPLLAELTQGKPALKLLNKQDLAEPAWTERWLAEYRAQPGTQALAIDASTPGPARMLTAACRALAPQRGGMVKPLRILVCGIPNVGKSTLINALKGQKAAKTGDEPGITKVEQRIVLAEDAYLFDTPGMLWPRIVVDESGFNLAAAGSIGRNAYDEQEVALALLGRVRGRHAERLVERYRLAGLAPVAEGGPSDEQLLTEIGRKRGGLRSGGSVDLQKAAEVVLNDFRAGAWGRLTLETPEEFAQWREAADRREAEREAKRAARSKPARGRPLDIDGAG
jgi:ribosome biogenesis GTPase A